MKKKRDLFVDKKQSAKNEKARKEDKKALVRKRVVEMALLWNAQRSLDEENTSGLQEGSEEQEWGSSKKRQKRGISERVDLTSGLAMFAGRLKDANMARVKLDEQALQFEKHKHKVEVSEREKDRTERHMERKQANKLELEKFKLMMDMLRDKQK